MEQKAFVTSDRMASFSCPQCGRAERKDVSRFIENKTKVRLKYTCSCGHTYVVLLERRRSIRKDVRFEGFVKKVNLSGHIIRQSAKYPVSIKDISRHGIRVKMIRELDLSEGEKLEIEFTLDDPARSLVSREFLVKKIITRTEVGCEFLSFDHHGRLGKYFLFYFNSPD